MEADRVEVLVGVMSPLLQSLEALGFIARFLNPPDLESVIASVGRPDLALREALPRLQAWPEELAGVRRALQTASEATITAFAHLVDPDDSLPAVRRALRQMPIALEALYPLAAGLAPVSRFFLDPALRQDPIRAEVLCEGVASDATGVFHFDNESTDRGGYSLYVPEDYQSHRPWPLVMALHGGSGHGRAFLWSWLRDARGRGAILIAPTAIGETWALSEPDLDTPNLERILQSVRAGWNVDPTRILLTGMSDGGTFTYVSGLESGSPFTHLAPVSAAFHPFLAEMADPERMRGLPIHITHGALDWMFEIGMARQAHAALTAAGAAVVYREISDLSHCYPREINPDILDWLRGF